MIELRIWFADGNRYEWWDTYENDNHIDEALDRAEAERGPIVDWYIKYLTDECV